MRLIYAEYNMYHNSIDVTTFDGYGFLHKPHPVLPVSAYAKRHLPYRSIPRFRALIFRCLSESCRSRSASRYAVNANRMNQLGEVIRIMKRTENSLDAKQVLSVIEKYSLALDLLDDYDHQTMKRPDGNKTVYILSYEECRQVIDSMKFSADSDLFGNEKDDSFKGSIGNIYQSFAGQDIYPTLEEKAANLLYFITKNHSFSDGNKRIAATMFLYFLDKNGILFADGNKLIDDHTLVALTIMIAESKPDEKEMMISVIMNCICG